MVDLNILFTCGGTAGHVNPAVALARIFQEREPGCRVLFVGADGGMETRLVPKEGYPIETVRITNFHRSFGPSGHRPTIWAPCGICIPPRSRPGGSWMSSAPTW